MCELSLKNLDHWLIFLWSLLIIGGTLQLSYLVCQRFCRDLTYKFQDRTYVHKCCNYNYCNFRTLKYFYSWVLPVKHYQYVSAFTVGLPWLFCPVCSGGTPLLSVIQCYPCCCLKLGFYLSQRITILNNRFLPLQGLAFLYFKKLTLRRTVENFKIRPF